MAVKTLTFEQIADSRSSGSLDQITSICSKLETILSTLPGIKVQSEPIRELKIGAIDISWRKRFFVQRANKKTSWNDVYQAVNSVKSVPYDFVLRRSMQ